MGISSSPPAQPFRALPPINGGSGITLGDNPNIRNMANAARQNVSSRQQRFINMMEQNTGAPAENNMSAIQQIPSIKTGAAPSEEYVKEGMFLVERRAEIDAFISRVLFG
jgi:hypothetical protein